MKGSFLAPFIFYKILDSPLHNPFRTTLQKYPLEGIAYHLSKSL
nr:MAG TPA: hypothetical protein [Caudoviricetes sp.]